MMLNSFNTGGVPGFSALAAIALAMCSLFLTACSRPNPSFRYKLIYEIATPEGVVTASIVQESYKTCSRSIVTGEFCKFGVRGEALFIELPGKRHVIAAMSLGLKKEHAHDRYMTFAAIELAGSAVDESFPYLARTYKKVELSDPTRMPKLIVLGDLGYPKTARVIAPNEFSAIFGAGYALSRVTVETTDEPVTRGVITSKLPVLKDQTLWGDRAGRTSFPRDPYVPGVLGLIQGF